MKTTQQLFVVVLLIFGCRSQAKQYNKLVDQFLIQNDYTPIKKVTLLYSKLSKVNKQDSGTYYMLGHIAMRTVRINFIRYHAHELIRSPKNKVTKEIFIMFGNIHHILPWLNRAAQYFNLAQIGHATSDPHRKKLRRKEQIALLAISVFNKSIRVFLNLCKEENSYLSNRQKQICNNAKRYAK